MDIIRAKEILAALADGVNPMTGEVLPSGDSCNQPDVIRALHTVFISIETKGVARPAPAPEEIKKEKPEPENAGAKWAPDEDNVLIAEFESGRSISLIAKKHGRSKGSIEARLIKLGKIDRD